MKKLLFFQKLIQDDTVSLTKEEMLDAIRQYIGRHDEELNELEKNRKGRHVSDVREMCFLD